MLAFAICRRPHPYTPPLTPFNLGPSVRRVLSSGSQLLGLVLSLCGMSSCSNDVVNPSVESVRSEVVVLLDSSVLKGLDARALVEGERLACAAPKSSGGSVRADLLTIGDTSLIAMDGAGVLYPLARGQTWISWEQGIGRDSVLVHVGKLEDQSPVPQTWTSPLAPEKQVDTRYPRGRALRSRVGSSFTVSAGGNLQAALDAAKPGDEVVLATGAVFTGNFVLPKKTAIGSDWIVVRAEEVNAAAGTRMTPELAQGAAKVITPNQNPAISTAKGADRWRLVGFEVAHAQGAIYNYGIVVLGRGDETSIADLTSNVTLDRMYIHGSPTDGASRCVALNGISEAVIDSWLSECHARGQDAQGVAGWGGPGPYLIENNFIEASGEIILFGGADPRIQNVTPSDITIRRNHLFKPLSWGKGVWLVKAVFELKHARRVLFEGNILENHWADGQTGFAIVIQSVSQDNRAPWSTVRDVLIQDNVIKNSSSGINLYARYNSVVRDGTASIAIVNNLLTEVGRDPISGASGGRIFQLLDSVEDVTILNNTITLTGRAGQALGFDGKPTIRTTVANNVFPNTQYGVTGAGAGVGSRPISVFMPGGKFWGNVLPGQAADQYPVNNYFPTIEQLPNASALTFDGICNDAQKMRDAMKLPSTVGIDCESLKSSLGEVQGKSPW